jgi:hypothetical protein
MKSTGREPRRLPTKQSSACSLPPSPPAAALALALASRLPRGRRGRISGRSVVPAQRRDSPVREEGQMVRVNRALRLFRPKMASWGDLQRAKAVVTCCRTLNGASQSSAVVGAGEGCAAASGGESASNPNLRRLRSTSVDLAGPTSAGSCFARVQFPSTESNWNATSATRVDVDALQVILAVAGSNRVPPLLPSVDRKRATSHAPRNTGETRDALVGRHPLRQPLV